MIVFQIERYRSAAEAWMGEYRLTLGGAVEKDEQV